MRFLRHLLACSLSVALGASIAGAQYSANFENPPYTLGQLEGQDIWNDWTGVPTNATEVVDTHNATPGGSQSIRVNPGADTVADFDMLPGGSFNSGQWILRAKTFVPSGSTGACYFLVMNQWDVTGTPAYEWNLQLSFRMGLGRVRLDSPNQVFERPLIYNTWVEVRAEYDLDADTVSVYYNDFLMDTYDPRCGVTIGCGTTFAESIIDAIDLYPDPSSNPSHMFFDDISVEPPGGTPGTPVCFGDGSGTGCPCLNGSAPGEGGCRSRFPGDPNGVVCSSTPFNLGTLLTSSGSTSLANQTDPTLRLVLTANNTTTQPGLFFSGNNTIGGGAGVVFGDGLRCCGQGVIRHQLTDLPPPGAGGNCPANGSTTVNLTVTGTPPVAGQKKCYQYWYRNPGARSMCGTNFNLSNAI